MTAGITAPWVPPWLAMTVAALWFALAAVLAVDMWVHRTARRAPTLARRDRRQPVQPGPYDWRSDPYYRQPSHVHRYHAVTTTRGKP